MKANIRGTEIYFDVAGMQLRPQKKGIIEAPVLFMLHGGPGGDHIRYKLSSIEIADVAQMIFIDHRGSGRSKKTHAKEYTLENNIEDIEALRKHLGLNKICILGTSYGGIVAQGYAIRYPKHVEKLILVATSPSYLFLEEAKKKLLSLGNKKQIQWGEKLWQANFKNNKEIALFFKSMDPLYSVTARKKRKNVFAKLPTIWSHEALNRGFGDFLRKYNFLPHLKKITCPTLILAGSEDWICSTKQSKEIANRIPHAKLKIFKNCSHAIAVDAHKQYIKFVKRFLTK